MKKLFIFLLFTSSLCSAQSFGVKLNQPKVVSVVPAKTQTVDSIYVTQTTEWSHGLSVNIEFYLNGDIVFDKNNFILWSGAEYDPNKDYTKADKKARIKTLLTQ